MKVKLWDDLTPAQKVRRWEGVERVMKKLTPHQRKKHFDMGTWGEKTECGTVGCVGGHCGLDRNFMRQGFRMHLSGDDTTFSVEPDMFFGAPGFYRVFLKTSASYKESRANISRYLKQLRAHERFFR